MAKVTLEEARKAVRAGLDAAREQGVGDGDRGRRLRRAARRLRARRRRRPGSCRRSHGARHGRRPPSASRAATASRRGPNGRSSRRASSASVTTSSARAAGSDHPRRRGARRDRRQRRAAGAGSGRGRGRGRGHRHIVSARQGRAPSGPAVSSRACAASGHPLAAQAGVDALAAGGSSVDAALTAAFARVGRQRAALRARGRPPPPARDGRRGGRLRRLVAHSARAATRRPSSTSSGPRATVGPGRAPRGRAGVERRGPVAVVHAVRGGDRGGWGPRGDRVDGPLAR